LRKRHAASCFGHPGQYDYIASEAGLGRINGTLEQGSFMVGYEYVTKQATVAGYIGGEVSHTGITPMIRTTRLKEPMPG